jgi:hypothetical protein
MRSFFYHLEISLPWDTPQNVGVCHFWHSFFLKMSVVRFLELIAKIGIAKIGIAKIGIQSHHRLRGVRARRA